jgi:hypothetical protein
MIGWKALCQLEEMTLSHLVEKIYNNLALGGYAIFGEYT